MSVAESILESTHSSALHRYSEQLYITYNTPHRDNFSLVKEEFWWTIHLLTFSGDNDVLSVSITEIINTGRFVKMSYLEDLTEEDCQIISEMFTINLSVEQIMCMNTESDLHSRIWVTHLQKTSSPKYPPTWNYHTLGKIAL